MVGPIKSDSPYEKICAEINTYIKRNIIVSLKCHYKNSISWFDLKKGYSLWTNSYCYQQLYQKKYHSITQVSLHKDQLMVWPIKSDSPYEKICAEINTYIKRNIIVSFKCHYKNIWKEISQYQLSAVTVHGLTYKKRYSLWINSYCYQQLYQKKYHSIFFPPFLDI